MGTVFEVLASHLDCTHTNNVSYKLHSKMISVRKGSISSTAQQQICSIRVDYRVVMVGSHVVVVFGMPRVSDWQGKVCMRFCSKHL